jgi:histidinol phosphatase-like PHP family hydrolase
MYKDKIAAVLDSLKNTCTAMEVSTKGLRKVNDFYPAEEILRAAAQRNIMTVISDDAHQTSELGKDFDKAEMILHKYGITERLKF